MTLLQQLTLLYQQIAPHDVVAAHWDAANFSKHALNCQTSEIE
jgi:hypothetical protein